MKKQFFRVKQLADQTFLRGEKTEELNNEELQIAERKVEYMRNALTAIWKKIPNDISASQENREKRIKKCIEHQLFMVFRQSTKCEGEGPESVGKQEDFCELFHEILTECADVEYQLAVDQMKHESKVDEYVAKPIQDIMDKELPNVLKLRKSLSKHVLDKDSAKNRYSSTTKHGPQRESIKTEMEDAEIKVEQSRDALAAEMFSILRRENEVSGYILQLLKLQRAHHESAMKNLDCIIPTLEKKIGDSRIKPIFGTSLEEHLRVTKRRIAFPLEICICALTKMGMSEEGLFRVAGSVTRIKRMKLSIDSGCFTCPLLLEYRDVHVIASTLKMYLRELPEPLLTSMLYNDWMNTMRVPEEQKLDCVKAVLQKLPQPNRDNLTYLMQFLGALSKHPETKMNSSNIAIVMAPNLLWQDRNSDDMSNCTAANSVIEYFVTNFEKLFDRDISCYLELTSTDLLEEEFQRPVVAATAKQNQDRLDTESLHSDTASPKTHVKKRKPVAPEPPSHSDVELRKVSNDSEFILLHVDKSMQIAIDQNAVSYSSRSPDERFESEHRSFYPSGSLTLTKQPKNRTNQNLIHSDDENKPLKRRSLAHEDNSNNHQQTVHIKEAQINLDESKTVEHRYVSNPVNIQLSTAKPVHQITAQVPDVVSSKPPIADIHPKPIAAPRTMILDDKEGSDEFIKEESLMTRSLNSGCDDFDQLQLRDRTHKPAVPIRPASLRAPVRSDGVQRTQCSVYNVPYKQQPSIVTIPNHRSLGHDTQMAEKERFLGHHQDKLHPSPRTSLESSSNDINSNCDPRGRTGSFDKPDVPIKPPHRKSNEMLNVDPAEKCNGNSRASHHVRTRSDGNIVEQVSLLTTPPSPKALNKPTEPPPPPPVSAAAVHKVKADGDSTDL